MKRIYNISTANREQDHFDLLPFINILMCTLGLLLLVALSVTALSLGQAPERWLPCSTASTTGSINAAQATSCAKATDKIPVLIEWDGSLLLAHLGKGRSCTPLPPNDTKGSCPATTTYMSFDDLTSYFRAQKKPHYALFAVRPSGFETFDRVKELFLKNDVEIGYEPIEQKKQVHLGEVD